MGGVNVKGADFREGKYDEMVFAKRGWLVGAIVGKVDWSGADLREANLAGCDLRSANLSNADLRGAVLDEANLQGANFQGACCAGASLKNANICATKFWETDLQTANVHTQEMDENTSFYMAKVAGATLAFKGWHKA